MSALLKEMEQKAGIYAIAHLALEKEGDGTNALVINTYVPFKNRELMLISYRRSLASPAVKDFNDGAAQFAEYLSDTLSNSASLYQRFLS
jgi:hypothetical protein